MLRYLSMVIEFLVSIYPLSVVVGVILVCLYALANALSLSKRFAKYPRKIRNIVFWVIDISSEWGPKCILFFILASLALQVISFFTQ